jgi:hypothetical protein
VPGSCFFDDAGCLHEAGSLALARGAQLPAGDQSVLDCAIRQRGFVAVDASSGVLRVRLVPAAVSSVTLSAVCYHLADREAARIAICWLDGAWHCHVFGSRTDAIRHLISLCPERSGRADDFKIARRSLDCLPGRSPLAALARLWDQSQAPLQFEEISQILHLGLKGRYAVVHAVDDGQVYFRDVGWGFPWLDKHWVSRSRGLRMQDQPDYHLGDWASEAYRDAAAGHGPRLDDVDAITVTPHLGRKRIRYTRLIVPVQTRWGLRCLLGASVINLGINLHGDRLAQ